MHVEPAHAELWTALTTLASVAAGFLRQHRRSSRKLAREVAVLKMQLEVHRQILEANGLRVPWNDAPRSDL